MRKLLRGLAWIVGLVLVVGLILRLTLMRAWEVPEDLALSSSLAPTLWAGDTVLLLTRGTPGFGDLVRCKDPQSPLRYVVGRIAGVEGDTVEADGGVLRVNGTNYPRETACPEPTFMVPHPSSGSEVELECNQVKMGGGWHYSATPLRAMPGLRAQELVGEGMVFLMSDNRAMPYDSRVYGTVPLTDCGERVIFRAWGKDGFQDAEKRFSYIR